MIALRAVRWPIAALAAAAVLALAWALAGSPWQVTLGSVSLGPLGQTPIGINIGVIQAVLLGLVAGVGTVVAIYSARNLVGQRRLARFAIAELAAVFALAIVVTTTSLVVLALAWTAASVAFAALVGHAGTPTARLAARQVRARLLVGDLVLWAAIATIGIGLGTWSVPGLGAAVSDAPAALIAVAAGLVAVAGMVRSALVPAHRWLPETAEAPSPVSALLHAGLVNGVGVLALLMWPLLAAAPAARVLLVVVGVVTALVAIAHMRTRADLKGRLAASTSSQMGYLAIQAGLGIPAAVLAHVVGHGVWKATAFLGAGDAVARTRRASSHTARTTQVGATAVAGVAAAAAVVVLAAFVPLGSWATLHAPAELLPLAVAIGVGGVALAAIWRVPVPAPARLGAALLVLLGGAVYVVALRGLAHAIAPVVGEPAAWSTPAGIAAGVAVGLLLAVAILAIAVDRRALAGRLPRLARLAARASLRPQTASQRLRGRATVALALPPVTEADADSVRADIAAGSQAVGSLYPLTAFVASNPLAGLEDGTFSDAARHAHEWWGATAGPSASDLRTLLTHGQVSPDDVDEAIGRHLTTDTVTTDTVRIGAVDLDLTDAVRRATLDDTPRDAVSAEIAHMLAAAGLETRRRIRTPIEAADLDPVSALAVTDLANHLCARTFGAPSWPGAEGPWQELRAHAGMLDGLLGLRGADDLVAALPVDPTLAIAALLEHLGVAREDRSALIARVLASQPGWAAHLNWRARHAELGRAAGLPADPGPDAATLLDELVAARLALEVVAAEAHGRRSRRPMSPDALVGREVPADLVAIVRALADQQVDPTAVSSTELHCIASAVEPVVTRGLAGIRLEAMEHAGRSDVLATVSQRAVSLKHMAPGQVPALPPLGQLIMCIDVRSERMRRQLEAIGPWETMGAAGFFGLPVRYEGARLDTESTSERAPALLRPNVVATEVAAAPHGTQGGIDALGRAVRSVEAAPGLAFGWAEAYGWLLAPVALLRTGFAASARALATRLRTRFTAPAIGTLTVDADVPALTDAAEAFLRTTGLLRFAPVVVLCGHGATVTNNPHVAAYDCGACGGAAGDVSARTMALILNDPRVRAALAERGIAVPTDTVVVAAQHDTTTDVIRVLDPGPPRHRDALQRFAEDAAQARADVVAERLPLLPAGGSPAFRAADWAQPRPEWGLAGAGAIVVGPRVLTSGHDLGGRVFLQSYRPDLDPDGSALEQLLAAPVVVAQWITAQYWASVVDPSRFGAGDKTTHNVVGDGVAVISGARSDLRIGLPWQAVSPTAPTHEGTWGGPVRHRPQRLLALVYADPRMIDGILERQPSVRRLVDGEWIALCAIDPSTGDVLRRRPTGEWVDAHPTPAQVHEMVVSAGEMSDSNNHLVHLTGRGHRA